MQPLSQDCNTPDGTVSRLTRAVRRPRLLTLVIALISAAVALIADPYPPYWGGGTGPSVHFAPTAWPADVSWIGYTRDGAGITDKSVSDGSNGGTSPQSYVNVSSGCTDETLPSVYYAFNPGAQVLYFRWRVQAPPHNYATGPNAGSYAAGSPWSSALWTVFIDTNGDGFRDFAVHLDGSSGGPATSIDRIAAFYSTTKSQSLDYINDPRIKLLFHNPAAFIDGPSGSDRILNFHNSLTPTPQWPNGSSETIWDYGTTRASLLNTGCGEYFIDYQIPLAMLDASAQGGPVVTDNTPMSLFFATANGLNNPLQKDVVLAGDFLADPNREVPGGDTITPAGGTILQPTVQSVSAVGCSATALTATIFDTLNNDRTTSVASASFHYYADTNANGLADDVGSAWTLAATAVTANNPVGRWTASWNSSSLVRGQYLIGVKAADTQGNVTWSYLTGAEVGAIGSTPPNYANGTGVIFTVMNNTCGSAGPSVSKTVSPSIVAAGQPVTFTVTVSNPLSTGLTVSSITDTLPAGFTYQSTSGAGTIGPPATSPAIGAGSAVTWTFGPATIPASGSRTLIFTANASSVAGTFANSVSAATSYGTLTASGTQIGVGSAALTLSKSASVSTAAPGDPVTYTITYSNDSPVNVTNAVITDVLPVGLDYVSASNGGSYVAGTRTVTWNVGAIASGAAPRSVTLAATFTTPYPGGAATPLVNTAGIASTETSTSSASSSVFVHGPLGQLRVQNQGNVGQVAPGGNVIYTLSYANIGDAVAPGATLTDVIPAGWSFVSATGGGTNAAGTVTWNLGSLAASATGSVTLTLQASSPYTGANPSLDGVTLAATGLTSVIDGYTVSVTQTGQVCSDYYFRSTTTSVGFDGTRPIGNTTAVTAASAGSSVSATSTGNGNIVEAGRFYQDPAVGSQVNFSVGSTLTSDIYIDRVNGAGVNVTGSVHDYNPASGTKTLIGTTTQLFNGSSKGLFSFSAVPSGVLQAGHRLLWIYTFEPANSQSVTLYLQFGGTTANPASGGTTAAISKSRFCTTAPASPVLNKEVNSLVASPGTALVYTIGFANAGGTDMTTAQIVDTLPSGVTFTSATLNGSAITPSGAGQVRTFTVRSSDTATAGQITGGQSGTLVVNASVTQPFTGSTDILTNAVQLASTQTSAVTDSITTNLERPVVTISKSVDDTSWAPGDTVTYTLQVVNGGPGTASAVTVTDALPVTAYFTYVLGSARLNNVTITPDPVSGGTLTKNIGALAAGGTATIAFDMLVASSGAPNGLSAFSNTATVADAGSSGTRSSNTVNATLSTNPNLTLTKTSSPSSGPVAAGSTIDYTLTVTNTGSGGATNVHVWDAIPTSTSYNAGTLQNGGVAASDVVDGDGGDFDGSGNQVVFDVATLAGGGSRTFTYSVTVATPLSNGTTTISSTATVTAGNASTRTATASIQASAAPVLTLVKSGPAAVSFPLTTLASGALSSTTVTVASTSEMAVGSTVSIGGTAAVVTAVAGTTVTLSVPVTAASGTSVIPTWEYRLDYDNTGTAQATNVVATDPLPAGLTFLSASAGGVVSGGTVTWTLGTVAAGTSGTLRVRVRPNSAGGYTNAATLVSSEVATVTSNSTSTSAGALSVTKTTTTPSGTTSGNVTTATYVIAVQNQSPTIAATGVTIADVLAPGFTYSSTTSLTGATASTSPSLGDSQPTWTGLTIPANGTATLTFVAKLSNVPAGTYQNELSVTTSALAVVGFDALSSTAEDVTLAATIGSTGTVAITPLIGPGGTLTISVDDPDLNTDALAVQTVQVTVVNTRTGESETVTLTETGASTGIFSGALTTAASVSAGANNAPPLNVATGDTVTASYADALTSTGGAATVTASSSVATGANSNPTANADATAVAEDSGATVIAVLTNDSSAPDIGETLTVTGITQGSSGGLVTLVGGVVSYTPAANFAGTETFSYTIGDGNGGTATATVTMTVANVNDNPTANADAATVAEDSSATVVTVLTNDSFAPDTGETLTVTSITQGTSAGVVTLVGGVVSYTPAANFAGTETFTYTISDGNSGTATTTVTMTVTNVNDNPTANADAATVAEDSSATVVTVLTNDSFAPDTGETLTVTGITQGSGAGVVTLVGGVVSYTPAANFAGTETFTYTIGDGNGGTATATVTMTVTNVNDNPTASADAATVAEDSSATVVTVLTNDSFAPDTGETLTVTGITQGTGGGGVTLVGGVVSYTPAANFAGTETFTYTIGDGNSGTATATVTMTVTSVNDNPTANADAATVAEDSSATVVTVLTNDSFAPDTGETLTVTGITQGSSAGVVTLVGGVVSYTPAANFAGTETFTYTIGDGNGGTATATVTMTVTNVNDNPTANADAATVAEDSSATVVTVLTNDSFAPDTGETLTVTGITQGSSAGVVTLVGGVVSYTPAANFAGTETFTYTIGDGNSGTATATVTMTVTNVNDNPTANADAATVAEDSGATVVTVLTNDSFAPDTGETLTVTSITQGTSAGVVTLVGGVVSYTPAANFAGTETFTYTISDGNSGTATATVTMTVTNNAPAVVTMTAVPLTYVENSGDVAVDTGLTVTDIDSPILVGAVVRIAANFVAAQDVLAFASQGGITGVYDAPTGALILTGSATLAQYQAALRAITYLNTSDDPSAAPRTVSVVVNDGTSDSNIATRTLEPQAVNDAPTLDQPAALAVDEDSGDQVLTMTGISSGAPAEAQTLTVTAVSSDTNLFTVGAVSYASPASTATVTLMPQPDAFGSGTLTVTVLDGGSTSGSVVRTIAVTIRPINDQPTLNAIPDRSAVVIGTPLSVPFDGSGTGAANEIQTLTVTAVSSNPSIVVNPVVTYTSPSATGTLQLTPLAPGNAVISVTVNDGGPENPSVTRTFRIGAGPNAPPTITPVAPLSMTEGQALPPSTFTVDDDATPVAQLTVTATSSNPALVPSGGLVFGGTGAARTITVTPLAYKSGESVITLTVSDGALTATTTFPVTVRPLWDYYLTEGATSNGFVTNIRVTNPHDVSAPIHVTFVRDDGGRVERSLEVPAGGMESIRINDLPELDATGVSTFIRSVDGLSLLVERTMVWGESSHGGHAETALPSTNTRWYFAEGAQSNTLSTWLVIANPNFAPTPVRVTFLRGGLTVTKTYLLAPISRTSIALSTIPELVPVTPAAGAGSTGVTFGIVVESDLPTVAERSTYLVGRRLEGGTVSAGAPYPATEWYFAEGSSWQIFSTYVLMANPNPETAQVTIRYNTMSGLQLTSSHSIAGYSRITVDTIAAAPGVDGEHYWMQVTADRPIVAERVMYWDRRQMPFVEAHNSHGLYEPAIHWTIGDGRVGGAEHFQTFLLLGNPASKAADLRVTYHRGSGDPIVTTRRLGAGLRANIQVNVDVPQLSNESFWATIESTNGVPIVVERSVYWDSEGRFTKAGTNVLAVPAMPASASGCELMISPRTVTAPAGGMSARIQVSATSRCTYTVTSSAAWIIVTSSASGGGSGVVELAVAPNASGAARTGRVTVAGDVISISQVAAEPPSPGAPFGYVDTPGNASTATGEVAVTGWALDDSGVAGVDVYRSPLAGEPTRPNGLVFVGAATLVAGARPDILALYPSYPGVENAGWGYMLLSNMLPNHGNGTFTLSAYVRTVDGANTYLGSKTVTFANAGSSKPFGTIDTPQQGQNVSGTITNFGWALTALPNSIPMDGSTIAVYVDGVLRGHPTYNNFRSDIAAQFPGYANSSGAVGYFILDTTALFNGVHTISWVVRDNAGNESGIGSRYFTVSNPALVGR